jgi:hypothetical protein
MIISVKTVNYKRIAAKIFSVVGLVTMFYFYYLHMSDRFKQQNQILAQKLNLKQTRKKESLTRRLEKLIYKEAEMAVFLLQQKNVRIVKIIDDKLFIECDYDTNIEPLLIRYGANALIKVTPDNIKIAIDLKFIVENRYEA